MRLHTYCNVLLTGVTTAAPVKQAQACCTYRYLIGAQLPFKVINRVHILRRQELLLTATPHLERST